MLIRSGQRALILAATCLTPIGAHALEIGSDRMAVAGVTPGMSYQEFHDALLSQGFTMIPGTSVTPGANSDILSEDGQVIASVYGYGADGGGRIIQVETGKDGQGRLMAFRITGIYSLDAATADFDKLDADFEKKFGKDYSCIDPAVGAVFQYDESLQPLATPDCTVSQPPVQQMPLEMVERTMNGEAWPFTATGVKAGPTDGVVTLIESVQDNLIAARVTGLALGVADAPATEAGLPTVAERAQTTPSATRPPPVSPKDQTPGSIEGFIAEGEYGPMPAFFGLEFGMPLSKALETLKEEGFEFRENFVPDGYRMKLYSDPIYYDTTMDIAFMPYPQTIVQELQIEEPSIRFKGFMANRRNDDGSIDTASASIVQSADYKGIDHEAPLLRIAVERLYRDAHTLKERDWTDASRALKFWGGCVWSQNPKNIMLFTDEGKATGRPTEETNGGCITWETVHEHRYRAFMNETFAKDRDPDGRRRMKKIEILIDDHQAIEDALRR